jgi:drug/metabolite transporter (DMT)-like permease
MSLPLESRPASADLAATFMPLTFVLLWSSGFIVAKLGLTHSGPFTLLALRFLVAAALLLPLLVIWRSAWPQSWREVGHIAVTGLLVNCAAIGCGFNALSLGLPTAIAALIGGLQPILTAVLAGWVLAEKVSGRQWLGLALGFSGVLLVLSDRLSLQNVSWLAVALPFGTLLALTAATLYQKRFCAAMPLRSGALIQLITASVIFVPVAMLAEGFAADWTVSFVMELFWLSAVLSIGALMLLWALLRRGAAAKVSSLFYLTLPVTAIMGWVMLNERLGLMALIGLGVVVAGVLLATRDNGSAAAS